jgi:two-component system, OmpR family, response regulator
MSKALKRIMCVDDETDILEVAKMCLETVAGFEVVCCSSGTEMLTVLQEEKPDLIMLDVMMPGMDGPATLSAVRQKPQLNHVPIILLTARVQPAEIEQYLKMGAAGVICKPFDPMTISSQITEIYGKFHES